MKKENIDGIYSNFLRSKPGVAEALKNEISNYGRVHVYTVLLDNVFEKSIDYHEHDEYEILYVIEGEVLYNIVDKQYTLLPGDMILIPKNTLHQIANPSKKSKRIILSFSDSFISHFSSKATDLTEIFKKIKDTNIHKISFTGPFKKIIENNLKEQCELFISQNYGSDLLYNMKLVQVLLMINNQFSNLREDYISNQDDSIISSIVKYIDENINHKILLEQIANYLSLSTSRVCHLFKEKTGLSLMQYINKKRLVLAKSYLRKGYSIDQAAVECGFQDYTSFFRSFKKEYNITPRTYIKQFSSTNRL